MAASRTSIANVALLHLGVSKFLTNVDSDTTLNARVIRTVFDQAVDEVHRDFPWPFATVKGPLTLIAECPDTEWAYSYAYPANCRGFHRIVGKSWSETVGGSGIDCSGEGVDYSFLTIQGMASLSMERRRGYQIPYRINTSTGNSMILTDQVDAAGEWTLLITDPARWPADFSRALAALIASHIAPALTQDVSNKLGDLAFKKYLNFLPMAHANAANEEQPDFPSDSTFESARV